MRFAGFPLQFRKRSISLFVQRKSMSEKQRQFALLFLMNFFIFLGINSMNILPAYLATLGAGNGLIGMFTTIPTMTLVLIVGIQLFRGQTYNKLRLLRLGFITTFIGTAGLILFHSNLLVMFLFYMLTGINYGAGFTNLFSMMYDITPEDKRRSYAALFGISGLMTSGLASIMAQGIYIYIAPHMIFMVPLVFSVLVILLSYSLKKECYTLVEEENFTFSGLALKPGIGVLIFQTLAFGGGYGIFKTFIPLFTEQRLGIVDITRFFGFFTLVGVAYRLVFSRFLDRIPRRLIMAIGFFVMVLTILYLNWMTKPAQLYYLGAFYGMAHSLLFPTLSAEFVRIGNENRAAYSNIFIALFTIGITASSCFLGILADFLGLQAIPYAITAVLMAALLSLFHRPAERSEEAA